jgi:hypothetical protein
VCRIVVALLVILGGCARTPTPRSELPVTEQQRLLATASISRLRDQFNRNECLSIYRESAPIFRSQREKDWLYDCAELRTGLGTWRTFTIQATGHCGVAVCADGFAAFVSTTKRVEAGFSLDRGQVRLMWFAIGDERLTQIFPGRPEPFADPPQVRGPGPV